jgi:hypothetical protein
MKLMKLLRKYPQRAIKIRGHFPQRSFKNSGPRVPCVDFTGLSILPAEGTVVALSMCGTEIAQPRFHLRRLNIAANGTFAAAAVPNVSKESTAVFKDWRMQL